MPFAPCRSTTGSCAACLHASACGERVDRFFRRAAATCDLGRYERVRPGAALWILCDRTLGDRQPSGHRLVFDHRDCFFLVRHQYADCRNQGPLCRSDSRRGEGAAALRGGQTRRVRPQARGGRKPVGRDRGGGAPALTHLFDTSRKEYRHALVQAPIGFSGLSYEFVPVAKADIMRAVIAARFGPEAKPSALDVGCGIGVLHRYIRDRFARLCAVDVSTGCLEQAARANSGVEYRAYSGAELPFASGEFDFAFAICVLHHVPPEEWLGFIREMARVIRPGGVVCIIEHNPLNPLTQLSVRRCEFDRDAVLLPAWRTARLMANAGLREIDNRYFLLLPSAAAPARAIERGLTRVPLGAQYITCGGV